MKTLTIIGCLIILCLLTANTQADENTHGLVKENISGEFQAWNADNKNWVSLELFWTLFDKQNTAKSWRRSDAYPNYNDVNEFDTFLVELKEGPCLMQFFHARWRRANDVQRWDDAFNEYGGCPYVFE